MLFLHEPGQKSWGEGWVKKISKISFQICENLRSWSKDPLKMAFFHENNKLFPSSFKILHKGSL